MNFDLYKVFAEMNVFAMVVVGALGLMAVASLAVFVERLWTYSRSKKRARDFGPVAARKLQEGDLPGLRKAAASAPANYLSGMLHAGLDTYLRATADKSDMHPVELVRRELARKGDAQAASLKRGLNVLASVGSVAPFVGLLGTVIGIIGAFQGIANQGSGGLGAVSAGIAEALVVTAIGLFVAIPAVLLFNMLSAKSDALMLTLDQARGEFTDHLEAHHSDLSKTNHAMPETEAVPREGSQRAAA